MGSVYRETYTKPVPPSAEIVSLKGKKFARVKPKRGKANLFPITTGKNGEARIICESATYVAKFRDGNGYICKVSTGCRELDAARSVLGKLERQAELVKSEVITPAEAKAADHQGTPIADHFGAYLNHLRAKGSSLRHVADTKRLAEQLFKDCGIEILRDLQHDVVEGWLADHLSKKMAARTRNSYLQAVRGFCAWCVQCARLSANPLSRIHKADEKSDRRRQRRAMTEAELIKLLEVARWRPLAEFGRDTLAVDGSEAESKGKRPKRSNWTYKPLTLGSIHSAVERARVRLAVNPEMVAELERLGRERALIYKTLVLTGLRKSELASLTVGQVCLDEEMPFIELGAADEKNRQGSTIPLRADLANDLRVWLSDTPMLSTLHQRNDKGSCDSKRPLFTVPSALVKILDRDLLAAGIEKKDERGRTVDVHALRHSFGTLLSKGGVAPRTAQAAMRHSKIDMTMNVYTDPKLLDIQGALDSLPSLDLNTSPTIERQSMRATGTDDKSSSQLVPTLVPNTVQRGQTVSFGVTPSTNTDSIRLSPATHENPRKPNKKALPTVFAGKADKRGRRGSNPQPPDRQSEPTEFQCIVEQRFTASELTACTTACTSGSGKSRKLDTDDASSMGNKSPEVELGSVEKDFGAALMMLATLPLTDEDRAEAVRRLLREQQ